MPAEGSHTPRELRALARNRLRDQGSTSSHRNSSGTSTQRVVSLHTGRTAYLSPVHEPPHDSITSRLVKETAVGGVSKFRAAVESKTTKTRKGRKAETQGHLTPQDLTNLYRAPLRRSDQETAAVPSTASKADVAPVSRRPRTGSPRRPLRHSNLRYGNVQDSHPTGSASVPSSREEGADRSKAPLCCYPASAEPKEPRYGSAVAEQGVPGRSWSYPRKRPAEVSEIDLRAELYREQDRFRGRKDRSVNSHAAVCSGGHYMTVRYTAEITEYEVSPVEGPGAKEYGSSWTWMALTTMLGALKSGYVFITEKLLGRPAVRKYDVVEAAEQRPQGHAATKRFKTLSPTTSESAQARPPVPGSSHGWSDNPAHHIGEDNIRKVLLVLQGWIEGLEKGTVVYPHGTASHSSPCDRNEDGHISLGIIANNLMIARYGATDEGKLAKVKAELHADLVTTAEAITRFYSPGHLEETKQLACEPADQLGAASRRLWTEQKRKAFRAAGDLLYYLARQADDVDVFRGTSFPRRATLQIVEDLRAYHGGDTVPSYLENQTRRHPPGHFDDDDILETASSASGEKDSLPPSDYRRLNGDLDAVVGHVAVGDNADDQLGRPWVKLGDGDATGGASGLLSRARQDVKFAKEKRMDLARPAMVRSPSVYQHRSLGRPVLDSRKKRRTFSSLWSSAGRTKRKAGEEGPTPQSKRQRITDSTTSTAGRAVGPRPSILEEESGWAFKPLPGSSLPRLRRPVVLPEDEPDEPQLKISAAKNDELRLVHQRRLDAAEAARQKEAEEQRRREEDRRRKEEAEKRLQSGGLRRPTREVIAPISDEWRRKVLGTLAADQTAELAKSPEGTPLTTRDFERVVTKTEWLNDEIVNSSLMHLANRVNAMAGIHDTKKQPPKCHAFSSFFWPQLVKGPQSTLRWMKRKGVTKANFLDVETILIPICQSLHWTMVVVQPMRRTVAYMDSMGPQGVGRRGVADVVVKWVEGVLEDKWTEDWRVVQYRSTCQTNGYDCGVHAVTNAIFVALGLDPSSYEADEMVLQRDRLAATLLNGGFTGDFDLAEL